ncbi:MAG: hypothetical protein JKY50_19105 [Oleispira sp.]|nr:hypothetical protein [Oleispira sp.]
MDERAYPNWNNCHADVVATCYPKMARGFFDDVVMPSISKLNSDIRRYSTSKDPVDLFYLSDTEDVLEETMKAFCLSIHSIWERQLRSYLVGCAKSNERHSSLIKKIENEKWEKLCMLFLKLRGISMRSFKAYDVLDTLQLAANVCRHGDGPSARRLYEKRPDFWLKGVDVDFSMPGNPNIEGVSERYSDMVITQEILANYVEAIELFWAQANYIYNESILEKHPTLIAKLEKARPLWPMI